MFVIGAAATAAASSPGTDFGERRVGYGPAVLTVETAGPRPLATSGSEAALGSQELPIASAVARTGSGRTSLAAAAALGRSWGTVTSTYRSPEHNRRVGGVRNSYHLSGRAVDIARRPGVSHGSIVAAYRNAGYRIVESLDEGDHSHLAFSFGASAPARPARTSHASAAPTQWRVVYAPR